VNDVLLLRNLDSVPQVFGPVLIMPGQELPPAVRNRLDQRIRLHRARQRQMKVVVEPYPAAGLPRLQWRLAAAGSRKLSARNWITLEKLKIKPAAAGCCSPPGRPVALRRGADRDSVIFPTPQQVVDGHAGTGARRHAVAAHRRLAQARGRRLRAGRAGRGAARLVDGPGRGGAYIT
jgi:hypothetical protein